MSFRRILTPIDFSTTSGRALDLATSSCGPEAEIVLLHVVQPMLNVSGPDAHGNTPPGYDFLIEQEKAAREKLEARAERLKAKGRRAAAIVRVGEPASMIISEAKRLGADLIVIGTQGRTGWSRFLMGSVAEKVVRMAECPVLTVRGASPAPKKTAVSAKTRRRR